MTTPVLLTTQRCLTLPVLDPEEKAYTEMDGLVLGSRMSSWELVSLWEVGLVIVADDGYVLVVKIKVYTGPGRERDHLHQAVCLASQKKQWKCRVVSSGFSAVWLIPKVSANIVVICWPPGEAVTWYSVVVPPSPPLLKRVLMILGSISDYGKVSMIIRLISLSLLGENI